MYNVICCMKSEDSYRRILSQYVNDNVNWDNFVFDIDDVKSRFTVNIYDLAIVDVRLWWKDEVIEFFAKQKVQTILFQGDFEDTLNQLYQVCIKTIEPDKNDAKYQVPESSTIANKPSRVSYIEKQIRVEVPVYKAVYAGIPNQLIIITNLSKRAGSTFITLNLAKLLSRLKILNCVIEPPIDKPYIFETVGLDEKLKESSNDENIKYISYPHLINENRKLQKDKEFIYDSTVWLVPDSRLPIINDWDYFKMMKLIYTSKKASTYLVDCGSNLDHESIEPIISEADMIIVVIDPMPTECMQNEELLEKFFEMKRTDLPVEFVINNFTTGVNKEELIDFIRIQPLAYIPAIDKRYIHEAIYNYKVPFEIKAVEDILSKPFYSIVKKLIPADLLKNYYSYSEKDVVKKFNLKNILRRRENEV